MYHVLNALCTQSHELHLLLELCVGEHLLGALDLPRVSALHKAAEATRLCRSLARPICTRIALGHFAVALTGRSATPPPRSLCGRDTTRRRRRCRRLRGFLILLLFARGRLLRATRAYWGRAEQRDAHICLF